MPSSCCNACNVLPKILLSDKIAPVISIGLMAFAIEGKAARSSGCVSCVNSDNSKLFSLAVSDAITQLAPEVLMITIRFPCGFQPFKYSSAPLSISFISRALKMPCFSKKASTTLSSVARAPVCDAAAA